MGDSISNFDFRLMRSIIRDEIIFLNNAYCNSILRAIALPAPQVAETKTPHQMDAAGEDLL